MAAPKNSKWFLEVLGPGEGHLHAIRSVLLSKDSPFQHIEVMDLEDYGRALVLDGKVQSTQHDEFIYHEALVHPVMLLHPHPVRVMIIGGGEGATLREVLRHRTVQRALMVDIDREVVDVSRALLPELHGGAFEDVRTELVFEDARRWLEAHDEIFDVIIVDLSDPIEEGPCYRLYTREFYQLVTSRLSPGGMISLQSGTVAPHDLLNFSAIYRYPLWDTGVAPYAFGGFGRQWDHAAQWSGHIGAGVEFRVNVHTGIFLDGRRVFEDRTSDYERRDPAQLLLRLEEGAGEAGATGHTVHAGAHADPRHARQFEEDSRGRDR